MIYGGLPGTLGKPVLVTDTAPVDVSFGLLSDAVSITEPQGPGFRSYEVNDEENLGIGYRAEGLLKIDALGYSWKETAGGAGSCRLVRELGQALQQRQGHCRRDDRAHPSYLISRSKARPAMAAMEIMELVYSNRKADFDPNKRYRNPDLFGNVECGVTRVTMVGNYPEIVDADKPVEIVVEVETRKTTVKGNAKAVGRVPTKPGKDPTKPDFNGTQKDGISHEPVYVPKLESDKMDPYHPRRFTIQRLRWR